MPAALPMLPDPQDTVVALSSAAGVGARAIIRLSGPKALTVASSVFSTRETLIPGRRWYEGQIELAGLAVPLPADLYVWPGPRTYTGQDLAELHTLSSPPLIEHLIGQLLTAGARAAQPGEFTLRAFLAGKLDLPRAEAVLGIIEAGSRDELKKALTQYAGGITSSLHGLREDLLDLLAEVEAGLDFGEEDIQPVEQKLLLDRLARGMALVTLLQKQMEQRSTRELPFRVVLLGPPNAGKSSLFNALAGQAHALVSPEAGTTRDYLVKRLDLNGVTVELVDTAGVREAGDDIEEQAQSLGQEQAAQADLLLFCHETGRRRETDPLPLLHGLVPRLEVATKCDLAAPPGNLLATSALTGAGLDALRSQLAERALAHARPALAPSLSRCRHHVEACLERLRAAHAAVLFEDPAEILALELRGGLDELGEMVGAVYSDDLLDRIFSRFCIGK